MRKEFLLRIAGVLGVLAILGLLIVLDTYYYEPTRPKVYRQTIKFPQVPQEIRQLKIVQLSDLHIVEPGVREQRMIRKVNALRPDLILLTGDYINDDGITPGEQQWEDCARNAIDVMKQMRPRLGSYAILGNWDAPAMAEMMRREGIHVLQDESVTLEIGAARLAVAGTDGWRGGLSRFEGAAPKADLTILLCHYPEIAEEVAGMDRPFDLVLAGHYHGGQVNIPFVRKMIGNEIKYLAGLYEVGPTRLYVNRGIGMHTEAVRFRCRPEITLIKLSPRRSA